MDYLIADENVINNNYRQYYSEKIIYLPNSFMPNNENQNISKKNIQKHMKGLPENSVVYCCFNKHYKITPKIFDIWVDILKNVENSILWLNSAEEDTKKIFLIIRKRGIRSKKNILHKKINKLSRIFIKTSIGGYIFRYKSFFSTFNWMWVFVGRCTDYYSFRKIICK